MPGEQRQTQTTNQSSTTRPWDVTQPALMDILGRFSGLAGDTSGMFGVNHALDNLSGALSSIPSFGADAVRGIGRMFQTNTDPQIGMLQRDFNQLNNRLGGIANGEELDPYKTPGFADAIARMTGDITNSVKGVYNASGRDPSGAGSFGGNLGQKLGEGIAPVIQSQFNTNNANRIGAANRLWDASGQLTQGMTNLGQVPMENIARAIGLTGQLPGIFSGPAAAQAQIAQQRNDLPWQSAQRWLQGVLPIAALGSQSSGTSQSERVQPESTFGNILGGALGIGSLFSGGANSAMAGLGSLLGWSDERLKENIAEVGKTHDGQPLYLYNYKGDDRPQIGLMAQEVEKIRPDAVHEIGGFKAVDYNKATSSSRAIGIANRMLEAA